jgi:hypothetical protein
MLEDYGYWGRGFRLANNWFDALNVNEYKDRPIHYLEIGVFCGANVGSVLRTYALHKDSKCYCIDPWEDYDEYPEYKGEQFTNYMYFQKNLLSLSDEARKKVVEIRGYSNKELPKLEDNFFDIIYIDGNHEPEYVLEDAVLAFRKLKIGGMLIFDDYGWKGGPDDDVKRGIDCFATAYYKRINILGILNSQVFCKRIS